MLAFALKIWGKANLNESYKARVKCVVFTKWWVTSIYEQQMYDHVPFWTVQAFMSKLVRGWPLARCLLLLDNLKPSELQNISCSLISFFTPEIKIFSLVSPCAFREDVGFSRTGVFVAWKAGSASVLSGASQTQNQWPKNPTKHPQKKNEKVIRWPYWREQTLETFGIFEWVGPLKLHASGWCHVTLDAIFRLTFVGEFGDSEVNRLTSNETAS